MCGIFGIVAKNARIPDGVLERGTQSLAHRGPDDSGTILLRDSIPEPIEIGLGNRRLAILDLSPLARDPMGIKPLYYAQAGSYFLFASEVRTLLGTGLVQPRIDPAGLINYLTFGSAYDPLTLVEGAHALPPGHTLTWEGGVLRQSSYWDLIDESPGNGRTLAPLSAENEKN